jgi:hypothetical protein
MTKKLLLLLVILLNFSIIPTHADDQVADLIADGTSADVLIDLPSDLAPGYHTAIAQITDPDTGQVTEEEINFCKDKTGEIHWDNSCPDLDIVVDPATLVDVTDVDKLPTYNPTSEPEKTAQTQITGFAALSVLSAGGAAVGAAVGAGTSTGGGGSSGGGDAPGKGGSGSRSVSARRSENNPSESHAEGSAEEALHSAHAKQSGQFDFGDFEGDRLGIGDRSFTWKAPFTRPFESAIIVSTLRISRFAPLFGKILNDATYLRAMLGSLSFFTIPLGAFIGLQAIHSASSQPMPPSWTVMAAMTLLSIFESIGGVVAALVYIAGVLISGNVNSLSQLLTILSVAAICVSPPLLAGSFRPFRRKIEAGDTHWERATDYLLAALLTNWTFNGFINSLNIIAAKQLAITAHAKELGIAISLAVILRMILEDLATYLYPVRLKTLNVEPAKPSKRQQLISNMVKAFIFGVVMQSFVGSGIPLLIGTLLFILPNIIKLTVGHVLPRSRMLHFALPKGGVRIVTMTILGTLFAKLGERIFADPEQFLTWGFVLLSIPGLVLGILSLLTDDKNSGSLRSHRVGIWVYRLGGIVIFYLIVQIAFGKNILDIFTSLFK